MNAIALSCQELVELVTDYLEDVLPAPERARFDAHIAGCEHCTAYLEQMRTTIVLTGRLRVQELALGPISYWEGAIDASGTSHSTPTATGPLSGSTSTPSACRRPQSATGLQIAIAVLYIGLGSLAGSSGGVVSACGFVEASIGERDGIRYLPGSENSK